MMIPHVDLAFDYKKHPLTWTLVFTNVFIFFMFFFSLFDSRSSSAFLKAESIEVTGRLYHQYLQENKNLKIPAWIFEMKSTSNEQMQLLGSFAIKQDSFLKAASNYNFFGDEVLISQWKKDLLQFQKDQDSQFINKFGLSFNHADYFSWITYQFAHGGVMHLVSNMLFLILIGMAVENLVGSLMLLQIYLLGGLFGGVFFLLLNNQGSVPMVGASASISALLAFYFIFESRKNIRYFYFLTPLPGQWGWIYLPKFLILPMFIVSDFTSLLSSPSGVGTSIAYSAHIGGTMLGVCLAVLLKYGIKYRKPLESFE